METPDTTPNTTPGFYLKQHVGRAQRTVSANTHPIKERLPIHYRSCRVVPKVEPTGVRAAVARRSGAVAITGRIPGCLFLHMKVVTASKRMTSDSGGHRAQQQLACKAAGRSCRRTWARTTVQPV